MGDRGHWNLIRFDISKFEQLDDAPTTVDAHGAPSRDPKTTRWDPLERRLAQLFDSERRVREYWLPQERADNPLSLPPERVRRFGHQLIDRPLPVIDGFAGGARWHHPRHAIGTDQEGCLPWAFRDCRCIAPLITSRQASSPPVRYRFATR